MGGESSFQFAERCGASGPLDERVNAEVGHDAGERDSSVADAEPHEGRPTVLARQQHHHRSDLDPTSDDSGIGGRGSDLTTHPSENGVPASTIAPRMRRRSHDTKSSSTKLVDASTTSS
jgi:hypothetical protein